ncbi:MAG: SGNH/GDSL hydrolase family protein [Bacteroidota bacterium]|jgi:hypothetical protein
MNTKWPIFLHTISCGILVFLFNACCIFLTQQEPISTGVIDADNSCIQYTGRFDFTNPKCVAFDWAGVYIKARFKGTRCSIRLNDQKNEYAVIVDNDAPRLLTTDTTKVYEVAHGLSDSIPHSIMIQKRTDPFVGKGMFMGFILDRGKNLLPPDMRPLRRIEFIGNSITSGYGVEGASSDCTFSPETENACMSYASMTARALNAEYHIISYSGRGVVRNYGDSNKTSIDPMPALYDRTCFFDSTKKWNFKAWIPQAVVVNLGTNDFSTLPHPDKVTFQDAYTQLLERIRYLYSGVTIFCVCGPMIEEPCVTYVKEIVEQQKKVRGRYNDVFFIEIRRSVLTNSDWGCEIHPNIYGASKMADIITAAMKLRMNW